MDTVTARSRSTVQAVLVTEGNMDDVSAWVHGRVAPRVDWIKRGDSFTEGDWVPREGQREIVFNEGYVTTHAHEGDWVLKQDNAYPWRVSDEMFRKHYEVVE